MKLISTEGYAELLQFLEYEENAGVFYWKIKPNTSKVKVGKRAGCKDGRGYYCIRYNKKLYPVHKLVWLKEYGFLPKKLFIDHINNNRGDNRKENLRLVDRFLNGINHPRIDCDITGTYSNIYLERKGYFCRITYKGKLNCFGPFITKEDAIFKREAFIQDLLDTWKELVFTIEGVLMP